MRLKTPSIYATGKWAITPPFSVDPNAVYVCSAIRSIEDLVVRGIDPYVEFYEPNGLDREVFNGDVTNMVNIITLMSDTNPTVYIPDTYISSYPDSTVIPYRHIVLSMSLGAVPDSLVLNDLKNKMEELTLSSIGVSSTVNIHQANSIVEGVSQTNHQTLENNRLAALANNSTNYSRVIEQQDVIDKQNQYIGTLEQMVKDNGLLA